MKKIAILTVLTGLLSGCTTQLRPIAIVVQPPGAAATLDNQTQLERPIKAVLSKNETHYLTVKKEGYATSHVELGWFAGRWAINSEELTWPSGFTSEQTGTSKQKGIVRINLPQDKVVKLKADADAGDPWAMTALGWKLHTGNGCPHNDRLARKYMKEAANKGNAQGGILYGYMLLTGIGGPKDVKEARLWLKNYIKKPKSQPETIKTSGPVTKETLRYLQETAAAILKKAEAKHSAKH